MATDGIIVTIDQSSTGIIKLADMAKRLEDKPKALARLSLMMRSEVLKNFTVSGRPAWPAWSDRYRESTLKSHKGKSHSLLTLSGRLKGTIQALSGTPAGVSAGSPAVKYAAVHNFGFPARNIPMRKFMVIPPEDMEKIAEKWMQFVADGKAIE